MVVVMTMDTYQKLYAKGGKKEEGKGDCMKDGL
jgi:hypothetical protein